MKSTQLRHEIRVRDVRAAHLAIAALGVLASACRANTPPPVATAAAPTSATVVDTLTHPAWTRNADIYEVNVRQFTPDGTLAGAAGAPAATEGARRRHPLADARAADRAEEPQGPARQLLLDRRLHGDQPRVRHDGGLRCTRRRRRIARGSRSSSTGSPNHTAFDHPWITAHKDYYVTRADGTIINARDNEGHDTDWTDVAELNYDNPEMRRAMIDEMRWWLDNVNDRRLPLRRRRRRADRLLVAGARRAAERRSPTCSCSRRPRTRSCTRRST